MYKEIILGMIILLFLVNTVSATNYYKIQYYTSDKTIPLTVYGISLKTSDTCTATYEGRATLTGTNYDASVSYYSPNDILIGSGSRTNLQNIYCSSFAPFSTTTSLNGFYEGKSVLTTTALSGYYTLTSSYTCEEPTDWFNISYTNNDVDSYGYLPYVLYYRTTTLSPTTSDFASYINATNYNECTVSYLNVTDNSTFTSTNSNHYLALYYPFNSTGGEIRYNFDLGDVSTPIIDCRHFNNINAYLRLHLVDIESGTYTTLHTKSVVCSYSTRGNITGTFSGNFTVTEKKMYAFMLEYSFAGGSYISDTIFRKPREVNIDIFAYLPSWVCTDWSECVNGVQYRTCTDPSGKVSDKAEYRTCAIVELQNYTLGFEDYYTDTEVVRCNPTWLFGCGYTPTFISVDRPLNWSIVEPINNKQYFLEMTSEWSDEGSRSLKMWYIPPKEGEPLTNSTCGNLTSGRFPQIYRGVNDSFFVARNITFPASNMMLSFTVKTCNNTVKHHDALTTLFGIQLCPEVCYGNCSKKPKGRFYFNIIDTTTSQSILGNPYYSESLQYPKTHIFDLSNLGIVTNRTYNIVFAITPESNLETDGYCTLFDNVRYSVIAEPLVCESRCIGNDYWYAKQTNGYCVYEVTRNALQCLEEEDRIKREKCEEYCIGTTKYIPTELCIPYEYPDYEEVPNHPDCIKEEEEKTAEELLYTPIVNESEWEESGLPTWILPLLSPIFVLVVFALGVTVTATTKIGHKFDKTLSWQFALIVFIAIISIYSLIGLFPIWLLIILIILAGMILIKFGGIFG